MEKVTSESPATTACKIGVWALLAEIASCTSELSLVHLSPEFVYILPVGRVKPKWTITISSCKFLCIGRNVNAGANEKAAAFLGHKESSW